MSHPKSQRLFTAIFASSILILSPVLIAAINQHPMSPPPPPQPKASPNAPSSQNVPQGLEGVPSSPNNKQSLSPENEQELRMQVQRLYAMATELKDEVDRTDENAVLSLAVVKRAKEIEKLARQIKDKAKH